LQNGFFECDDPIALQKVCDAFSAEDVDSFFRRWLRRLPHPFTAADRRAGMRCQLSILQMEVSLTQVFERSLHRTETTFNDSYDFDIGRNLGNLPRLRTLGRHINHRLLTLERVAQHCAIASQIVERIVLPTVDDGQRAPALRWGDPRTMALFSALCAFSAAPEGITNRSLRERVGALYDSGPKGYTQCRMSYDLRRLRLKGLLQRVPKSHRYVLTSLGRRVALFMSKSFARLVRPVLQRLDPSLPDHASDPLRRAWRACERAFDSSLADAKMAA